MKNAHPTIGEFLRLAACLCVLLLATWSGAEARDLSSMSGEEVKLLQQRLTDADCYTGAVDGTASEALEAAKKACPDQEPILRIDSGMHTAPIISIAVDAQCRIAATSSRDKTVRLWSMPDGKLIRTPRLPIGDGISGRVNAVAVSSDGRLIAAGGIDARSYAANPTVGVYFFDSVSGVSLRRVGAFDNYITQLTFSPDASKLAVGLGGGGIRVIDVATGGELMADRDYSDQSLGVAFGSDGALYATGLDGFLRRYDTTFKRTAKVKTPGGNLPFSVAVDPGGRRVAVGYDDTHKVDIFDARDLRAVGSADTSDLVYSHLSSVAWSRDGRRLFGGGVLQFFFNGKPRSVIRSWTTDGRRAGADVWVSSNSTIMSLVPCGADVAFAAADPAFGILKTDGVAVTLGAGHSADMRNKIGAAFMVSADAKRVRFGLGRGFEKPVLFDFSTETVIDAPIAPKDIAAPRIDGLDRSNSSNPRMLGKPIAMRQHDFAISGAVRGDKFGFVLGTNSYLRAFNSAGVERWSSIAPDEVFGVNLAKDDSVVVAAYGDGMIRWHRWTDGQELLALFVDAKDRRWVAWTPTGYYMASAGGEDLIGWHVNRGWEQQADFFPASRFRHQFNRPDIVRLVLETLDEGEAVKRANETAKRREDTTPLTAKLPPVIRIDDLPDGGRFSGGEATIGYGLRSPSGLPIDHIDVLIDGRPVKEVGLPLRVSARNAETPGSLKVALPPRDVEVGLIAWSGEIASEAVRANLTWTGAPAPSSRNRRLHALLIGVSNYVAPDMALDYSAKDANDFAKALQNQQGGYYSEVEARVVVDRDVTRASLIAGLEWLEKQATGPDDVSVLFLAGHGLTDEKQTYWFLPSDATEDDARAKGVSQEEVRRSLQSLPGKVLWFLDTCHAGSAAQRAPVDINVLVNTVTSAEDGGIVAFASTTGREASVESSAWQNGAFTKAIVEGIEQGKADLAMEGTITTSELDFFLAKRVRELTDDQQHPVMGRPPQEPDFTIAQVRKQ